MRKKACGQSEVDSEKAAVEALWSGDATFQFGECHLILADMVQSAGDMKQHFLVLHELPIR